jgi:hypothetical protein
MNWLQEDKECQRAFEFPFEYEPTVISSGTPVSNPQISVLTAPPKRVTS